MQTIRDHVNSSEEYRTNHISVEHYIVSTGLRRMILGSKAFAHVDGVWGCEFVERFPKPGYLQVSDEPIRKATGSGEIVGIGYSIDNTTKTGAIFEINKGTNKYSEIDVNAFIPYEDRRIPFQNMVYIADGPSDVPVFSVLMQYGGKTIGVYKPKDMESFRQVNQLLQEHRVQHAAPADYRAGEPAYLTILTAVDEIASRIVDDRYRALRQRVGRPPRHLVETQEEVLKQLRLEAGAASEVSASSGRAVAEMPITDRTIESKQELFSVPPVDPSLEGPARRRVLRQLRELVAQIESDTHVPTTAEELMQLERYVVARGPRRTARGRRGSPGDAEALRREEIEDQLVRICRTSGGISGEVQPS